MDKYRFGEPWTLTNDEDAAPVRLARDRDGYVLLDYDRLIAERQVACVNALAGHYPARTMEPGSVTRLIEAVTALLAVIPDLDEWENSEGVPVAPYMAGLREALRACGAELLRPDDRYGVDLFTPWCKTCWDRAQDMARSIWASIAGSLERGEEIPRLWGIVDCGPFTADELEARRQWAEQQIAEETPPR